MSVEHPRPRAIGLRLNPALRAQAESWAAQILSPFRHRMFLAVWLASLVSNLGGLIQGVGASLTMTEIAPSPEMVALVSTAATLPFMLFALPAGALADIMGRRLVMVLSLIANMAASVLLTVVAFGGGITPTNLLFFTFLIGVGAAMFGPAWQSAVGELVPESEMPQAVALNSLGFNLARCIGPAIGGAIVMVAGAAWAFAVNAASYIALIVVLLRWKRPKPAAGLPPESFLRTIETGLRYVSLSPPIMAAIVRGALFGLCAGSVMALTPIVARDQIGDVHTVGLLLGAYGVGAMIGALLSPRMRSSYSTDGAIARATLAFAAATVVIALTPWLAVVMLAMTVAGAAWVMVLATLNIAVQMSAPRWVVGRAASVSQMSFFAGFAAGAALWGYAAKHVGLEAALIGSALCLLATMLAARALPIRAPEPGELAPSNLPAPLPPLDLDPRTGPIVVTIQYTVDPARASDFAAAMRALGAIRRRDGARRWTLAQDLDDLRLWTERYESPTWLDHLRRVARPTLADLTIREKALSFHEGAPPIVRRFAERPHGAEPVGAPRAPSTPARPHEM